MQQVKECMNVTIEFTLRSIGPNGDVSEMPPRTVNFVYGVDVQYPSVEKALLGKIPGERIHVRVPPEEVFGIYDEGLVRELPREDYKQDRLQEGKMYREMRKKTMIQFLVKEIRDEVIVADFNDARAGTSAEFDILIKEVREATKEEMKPSCTGA